jgi:CMP-N,N'-diacetyllegionaminic acid synthase
MSSYTAIIPARGGSKGLRNKNITCVGGKSLVLRALECVLDIEKVKKIIITSDSDTILCSVPEHSRLLKHKRENKLATDTSDIRNTVSQLINSIETDYVMLLQPTSPLRSIKHVLEAIKQLENSEADSLISICKAEHSIGLYGTLNSFGQFNHFVEDNKVNLRRQDAKTIYRLNGAIYISKVTDFKIYNDFRNGDVVYYEMPSNLSIDIDSHQDLLLANFIYNNL